MHPFDNLLLLMKATMVWRKAPTTGNHPAPRDSHSMSSWNSKLIVLGGEDASNSFLSDIYILDTGEWAQVFCICSVILMADCLVIIFDVFGIGWSIWRSALEKMSLNEKIELIQ